MQAIFSAVFYFSSVSLYPGFMMVGFSTVYTMFPVFSLVLDKDVSGRIALMYPELYKDLSKGRSLTFKTFFTWCLISIYQGGVIMFGALLLFEDEFIHVVSISFTALILTELIMVALTIRTWHWLMVLAEFLSFAIYIASLIILKDFFGKFFFSPMNLLTKFRYSKKTTKVLLSNYIKWLEIFFKFCVLLTISKLYRKFDTCQVIAF